MKPSSNVRAGRRKYVLDEAGEGEEENEGISQKEIDKIYNGISDRQDQDDPKEDVKNYILPKKPKLDHVNPSEDDTNANDEAIKVGRPTKDHQTAFAMVSPDKEDHRLPPAQNKASSWPSVGRIDLTIPATRSSQQEPDDGTFAIHRPSITNPYLNKKQPIDHPDHHRNGGNKEKEDDDDNNSCDSVKAFLLPTIRPEQNGMPLGELASDNEGRCYYEFLQGGMLIFTAYNGNRQPAFTLHATIAAKFRMPPFHSHLCSGVNYRVAPNTNERLMLTGNKCYTGVVVNWTDFHGKSEAISFFRKYVHFLNTHL
jgi:hypothetical protein